MVTINHYRRYPLADRTLGEWWLDGVKLCDVLEPPWKDNANDVSCIPEGEYDLVKGSHSSYGGVLGKLTKYACYTIDAVPNRTDIDVHIGNYPHDTKGCILVGRYEPTKGMVLQDSTKTFNGLMEVLNDIDVPIRLKVETRLSIAEPPHVEPSLLPEKPTIKPPAFSKVNWLTKLWALFNLNKRNLALALGALSTVVMKANPEIGGALLALSTLLGAVGITHDVKKRADNPQENDWVAKLMNVLEQLIRTFLIKRKG